MTELDQWDNDMKAYNDKYEDIALKINQHGSKAVKLLRPKFPSTEAATESVELCVLLERLVEVCADAAYNYRGIKNFYERTLVSNKLMLMSDKEKKVAANVAESKAIELSLKEFELLNEAERYYDIVIKRYQATERLIDSIHLKLNYGNKP